MAAVEAHLALNHLPFAGVLFGLGLLVVGIVLKKEEWQRIAYAFFFIASLITIPVFLAGHKAHEAVDKIPGFSHTLIETHEEAATAALVVMVVLGLLMATAHFRFKNGAPRWFAGVTAVMALGAMMSLAYASKEGGEINHPEVRDELDKKYLPGAIVAPGGHMGQRGEGHEGHDMEMVPGTGDGHDAHMSGSTMEMEGHGDHDAMEHDMDDMGMDDMDDDADDGHDHSH